MAGFRDSQKTSQSEMLRLQYSIMKSIHTILLLAFSLVLKAQYISEVIEYVPAPGQFINTENTGSPTAAEKVLPALSQR